MHKVEMADRDSNQVIIYNCQIYTLALAEVKMPDLSCVKHTHDVLSIYCS